MTTTGNNTSKQPKFIFITGGVLSGLGKGVVSASIGKLIDPSNKIVCVKCDGYLNVDPGTMNPMEHGEVFVLEDGGECDLDFGHYERFLNIDCKRDWSISSGKIFQNLIEKERKGDFLGKTVQVIPHATSEIQEWWQTIAKDEDADVVLIEMGGTVGDYEIQWFLWAAKELRRTLGRENVMFAHLGLLPVIDGQGQQKTKPIQQSVTLLQQFGIFPDVIIGRTKNLLTDESRSKIQVMCNVDENAVASDPDLEHVYELPLVFAKEGLDKKISSQLGLSLNQNLDRWKKLVDSLSSAKEEITIAICGKYTDLADSYISVVEALKHSGAHLNVKVNVTFVSTVDFEKDTNLRDATLGKADGLIVPGGFGNRGTEGKIAAVNYAREHNVPFLGICYGLQLAVIEFARNVCGLADANSMEIDVKTAHPVVHILEEQKDITKKGGTMRLGSYAAYMLAGSKISELYATMRDQGEISYERHRHRYEVNPKYHSQLIEKGLVFAGTSKDKTLVEFIELPNHKYFVATQAHPELKSRLEDPAPLFYGLVEAALKK